VIVKKHFNLLLFILYVAFHCSLVAGLGLPSQCGNFAQQSPKLA